MPNLQVHYHSKILAMDSTMNIIVPTPQNARETYPVLWLLHGGGGNENDWLYNTGINRYAQKHNIAVVMPCAGISRYCNMTWGGDYFDALTWELPRICRHYLPGMSEERGDNFIAGLSLGGSGAISLGMRCPEQYGYIGVLSASSIIPLEHLRDKAAGGPTPPGGPGHKSVNMLNFGVEDTGELVGTEHDVLMHARNIIRDAKPAPKVFHAVGMEDHAYPVGLGLKAFFEGFEGNPFRYEFHTEHGAHSWDFWDKWIAIFLDSIMVEKEGE